MCINYVILSPQPVSLPDPLYEPLHWLSGAGFLTRFLLLSALPQKIHHHRQSSFLHYTDNLHLHTVSHFSDTFYTLQHRFLHFLCHLRILQSDNPERVYVSLQIQSHSYPFLPRTILPDYGSVQSEVLCPPAAQSSPSDMHYPY